MGFSEDVSGMVQGNVKDADMGLVDIQPGLIEGQALIFPLSNPVGKFLD